MITPLLIYVTSTKLIVARRSVATQPNFRKLKTLSQVMQKPTLATQSKSISSSNPDGNEPLCTFDQLYPPIAGKSQQKTRERLNHLTYTEMFIKMYSRGYDDKSRKEKQTSLRLFAIALGDSVLIKKLIEFDDIGSTTKHSFSLNTFSRVRASQMPTLGVQVENQIPLKDIISGIETTPSILQHLVARSPTSIATKAYVKIFAPKTPEKFTSTGETRARSRFERFMDRLLEQRVKRSQHLHIIGDEVAVGRRNNKKVPPVDVQYHEEHTNEVHHTFLSGTMDFLILSTHPGLKALSLEPYQQKNLMEKWKIDVLPQLSRASNISTCLNLVQEASRLHINPIIPQENPLNELKWRMVIVEAKKIKKLDTFDSASPLNQETGSKQHDVTLDPRAASSVKLFRWALMQSENFWNKTEKANIFSLETLSKFPNPTDNWSPPHSILIDFHSMLIAEKTETDVVYLPSYYLPVPGDYETWNENQLPDIDETQYRTLLEITAEDPVNKVISLAREKDRADKDHYFVVVAVFNPPQLHLLGRKEVVGKGSGYVSNKTGAYKGEEDKRFVRSLWETIAQYHGWKERALADDRDIGEFRYYRTDWEWPGNTEQAMDSGINAAHIIHQLIQHGFHTVDTGHWNYSPSYFIIPNCFHEIRWAMYTDIYEGLYGLFLRLDEESRITTSKLTYYVHLPGMLSNIFIKAISNRTSHLRGFSEGTEGCEWCSCKEDEDKGEPEEDENDSDEQESEDGRKGRYNLLPHVYQPIAECLAIQSHPELQTQFESDSKMLFMVTNSNDWLWGVVDCSGKNRRSYVTETLRVENEADIGKAVFMTDAWLTMSPGTAFNVCKNAHDGRRL